MRRLVVLVVVALAVSSCRVHRPIFTPPLPGLEVLPSRTKAVHIHVVPADIARNADDLVRNAVAVETFVASKNATMNDVFIVGTNAMSYSFKDKRLRPILEAAALDWESIPFVDTFEKEQIQWQSEGEFAITAIEKYSRELKTQRPEWKKNAWGHEVKPERKPWTFDRSDIAPANPFARLAGLGIGKAPIQAARATGPDPSNVEQRTIRSGIANLNRSGRGQLYRLSLSVTIAGTPTPIEPGIFVLACGWVSDSWCDRRHVKPSPFPNRTKVVRLRLVDEKTASSPDLLKDLVLQEGISESDVLIVGGHPKSYLHGRGLTDHEEALQLDDHSVIYVMVQELEQLQWESNTDFFISKIEKKPRPGDKNIARTIKWFDSDPLNFYDQNPKANENPFAGFTSPKQLRRQHLSGVATLPYIEQPRHHPLGQLYKVSFEMMIDGKQMAIDPDLYCDM